ncbi:sulfite exporter TauE/SafE family protein [bacterium]|nr:MAG: sulfite exporter TauE/SafE family protein [bacterium]
MLFDTLTFVAALLAGAVAAVAGFGIGSLLTPLFAFKMETKLAVAAVSCAHLAGTALRFWLLRRHVDRDLLLAFGLMSAAGGLAGALLHTWAENIILTVIFGLLLLFAGISGITGLATRMRFTGWMSWMAGMLSGLLGGLVGTQGGIRSEAMLGFELPKKTCVATATAIALIVDGARMPVYLATRGSDLIPHWPLILAATAGVLAGTLAGGKILTRIDESIFRRIVSVIITILGIAVLSGAATK